jgi:hypothetical protein
LKQVVAIAAAFLFAGPLGAQRADSTWTIRAGAYAEREVRLDPVLAARKGSAFLKLSKLEGERRYVGWNPSKLPARVAFRPGKGITGEDSAAFWAILDRMESDVGMNLFEPADISSGSDPDDVVVVETRHMPGDDGRTFLTWSNDGGVYDVRVYFRSAALLHSERIVTHEMMHALGFGHTSQWTSVMNVSSGAPASLTVEDVAYAQFAFYSRAANEREDMWERLALANDREPRSARHAPYEGCPISHFKVVSAMAECSTESQLGGGAMGASGTSH